MWQSRCPACGMGTASRRSFIGSLAAGALAGHAATKPIATVKFGNTQITRLILGGNPILGYSHSVQKLSDQMREYFTVQRTTDLILHAEEEGITTFQSSYSPKIGAALNAARERGSKMQWINITHSGQDDFWKDILALRPIAIAHHGSRTDEYFHTRKPELVRDYLKKIHDAGIFAGISTHSPKHVAIIEDLGWENDFYMTCLYYVTRTLDELKQIYGDALVNSREEPFLKGDPERMLKQVRGTRKPCLAFKILAAGRNCMDVQNVEDCFRFAYANIKPIDAVIVGMYPVLNDEVRMDADLGRKYSNVLKMRRRTFVAGGLAASAAACSRAKSPWRFFTPEEARTVEAVCGRIIPDDHDPGAVQAGVVNYIDTQLAGFYRPLQKTYREGLAALGGFAALPPEAQTARLQQMEKDPRLKPFFDLLVAHTMQGFYGDPRHGGNRDRVSWKMLGLPYPQIRGRLPAKGQNPWL